MATPVVAELPPLAPSTQRPWVRAVARAVLRLAGWKLRGAFPNRSKLLLLAVPHSSAWDVIWGMLIKLATGMDIQFMAKQELFFFPLGALLSALGAVPVDRHAAHGVVGAMVERFASRERVWVVLAPEGTRRKSEHWRTGFWHIARAAQVPVCCIALHYPEREFSVGPSFEMSDDMHADIARLRDYYAPFQGKHRRRN
ncbi:MAG: 1-acyl-sn-glycerol-3-phosphate acyltransferase [Lysobacterales bacterium]